MIKEEIIPNDCNIGAQSFNGSSTPNNDVVPHQDTCNNRTTPFPLIPIMIKSRLLDSTVRAPSIEISFIQAPLSEVLSVFRNQRCFKIRAKIIPVLLITSLVLLLKLATVNIDKANEGPSCILHDGVAKLM
jgi:hypothetical protein